MDYDKVTDQDGPYDLLEGERFWVDMQPLLLRRGYQLRPRYDPDWAPSWLQKKNMGRRKPLPPSSFEDSISAWGPLLDAIRVKDDFKVVMKIVPTNTNEIPIAVFLSSRMMMADSRNCSVPIIDVIIIPGDDDKALLVMPCLLAIYYLPFRHYGEVCEAFLQLAEGLEFLHEQNIVHRDICDANIAMNITRILPNGYHFYRWPANADGVRSKFVWKSRWSVRPNRYFIIDYGISTRCSSKTEKVTGRVGQDRSVPEMSNKIPYDPFAADVYQLGNVFMDIIRRYTGLDDFRELAERMTERDPTLRATAADASKICRNIVERASRTKKMSMRIWAMHNNEIILGRFYRLAIRLFGWNTLF